MMVRYFLVAAAVMASLATADSAFAWGRRGCSSCSMGGGCPGGVCAVPVAPGKMAVSDAPPAAVVEQGAPAPAVTPAASAPVPRYYANNNVRRGLFGWRR